METIVVQEPAFAYALMFVFMALVVAVAALFMSST